MRRAWPLAAILGVALGAAEAQVRLSGRVVDDNNAAVPAAQVTIRPARAGAETRPLQTVTDPGGKFLFRLDASGEYLLSAERENYFRLKDRPVRLAEGSSEVTLVLNVIREVFERIDVSYSPPQIDFEKTTPERRLTGTQMLEIPYPSTASLRNAMRVMPGVVQDSKGGLHLNGGAEEQVLYTLDGFQINDPLTGRFESRMSVESVRSVEVAAGNLSAEFGKGSAGVLSVKTATGDDRLRYSGTNFVPGLESRKGLLIGGWTPRFNLSGPLRQGRAWFSDSLDIRYDQWVIEELPKGGDRTTSWRWNNLLRNQVNLTPSNILYTGFLANYWYAPRTGLGVLDPLETTVDRRARQWFFNVKDQLYLRRGALLEVGYGANRTFAREIPQGHETFEISTEGKRGNFFADAVRTARRDQFLANLFLPSFSRLGSHQIKLGADLDWVGYYQDVRRTSYEYYRADGTRLRRVIFGGTGRFERSNVEAASYAQDSWKLRPGLMVELGLRQDWDRLVGNTRLAPRAGFAWAPPGLESTKLSGGFAVIYDQSLLRLFTRPLDQHSLTTYFDRDGTVARGPAVSLYRIDDRPLETPRYHNWNVGLEQRLPGELYARFGYVRRRGHQGFTYASMWPHSPLPPAVQAAFPDRLFDAVYRLENLRRDVFDSFEVTLRQTFRKQYEWMASYTRSRAFSNAVVDLSVDDPVLITTNVGRMPWDTPNRLLSWGYLPFFWHNWAVAYLLEVRDGFPFSVIDDDGRIQSEPNAYRFPLFFEVNLHLERRFFFRKHRWALRAGFNNLTNRKNPNVVNNNASSPHFMALYGGQSRALNFRIRWLGRQ
jgi:hypothetical protein